MEAEYARRYRDLYEKHWWWRAREQAVVDLLRRGNLPNPLHILDVGCGDALFFDRLAEFGSVEGVEADSGLLDPANPHRSKIYTGPFDRKFKPGKQYGLIVMLDVLEHLDNPAEALGCVGELLEDGGRFLLTVPAFQVFWTAHDVLNQHRVRYRKKTLFPLLRRTFAVIEAQYWFQWMAPVKLGMHFAQKIAPARPALPQIPPAWLNKCLFLFSRLEQRSIAPLMPFGTTLMALCAKAK